jgi:hypothetical protein
VVARLCLALLALAAATSLSACRPSEPQPDDQLPGVKIGERLNLVGQIVALDDFSYTIEVLEGRDFQERTGRFVTVLRTGKEVVLSGNSIELQLDAIAQFEGPKVDTHTMTLERVTILTGYKEGPPIDQ